MTLQISRGWTANQTLLGALGYGLPLVIVPLQADQPDNAPLCARLGVARALAADALTPERAWSAVCQVLSTPEYRRQAEHIKHEIAAMPSLDHTADVVEAIAHCSGKI